MINTQELQGQWHMLRGKVQQKWSQLTHDDLQWMNGNIEQLIGRIQQRTGEGREAIEQFLSELVPAESLLQQGVDSLREHASTAAQAARQSYAEISAQAQDGLERADHFVRRHPRESLAAIFGMGLVMGAVVGLLLNSSENSTWQSRQNHWW